MRVFPRPARRFSLETSSGPRSSNAPPPSTKPRAPGHGLHRSDDPAPARRRHGRHPREDTTRKNTSRDRPVVRCRLDTQRISTQWGHPPHQPGRVYPTSRRRTGAPVRGTAFIALSRRGTGRTPIRSWLNLVQGLASTRQVPRPGAAALASSRDIVIPGSKTPSHVARASTSISR